MDKSKENALFHLISTNGSKFEDYERMIQEIENINYVDPLFNRSYLQVAIQTNREDIINDLLERGIDVNIQDKKKNTAAAYIIAKRHWDLLRKLKNYGLNPNIKGWKGNTILWVLIRETFPDNPIRYELIKLLLDLNANPLSTNESGKTPLFLAKFEGDEILVNILENYISKNTNANMETQVDELCISTNEMGIYPIPLNEYVKLILVQGVSLVYLKEKTIDYGKICAGKMVSHRIKMTEINGTNWCLVSCPKEMNFYNYHNLMSWFCGTDDQEKPTQNICVAFNEDARYSYYAVIEDYHYGDTLIGRFQNGESFSIDLPGAYIEGGNAKECYNSLGEKNINMYFKSCGFDGKWLEPIESYTFTYVDVDIAVE